MKKKIAIFIMTALLTVSVAIPASAASDASAASYTTNLSNVHNDEITEVNPERTAEIEKLNDERSKLLCSLLNLLRINNLYKADVNIHA